MFHAKLIAACYGLMLLASPGSALPADRTAYDPYAIPRDKTTIESCRQAALAARPGRVEKFEVRNTSEGFHYRFEIEGPNRLRWAVICDAATQHILKTQSLEW
jgi:uncharacterized membrane protein YkoI